MASSGISSVIAASKQEPSNHYRFALGALTSLFFMWGFITCMNDILIPHLKETFSLSYVQAMMVQFCFFAAYFLVSLPAGWLVHRIGHQRGIVVGLTIAGLGCVLFYPAAGLHQYVLFLGALFVLASGITVLQVAANPYVVALGKSKTAPSRLTLTQAFNSLGTTVAPIVGGAAILAVAATGEDDGSSVQLPYLIIAALLFLLAVIFAKLALPVMHAKTPQQIQSTVPLSQHRHLIFGVLGIFMYVGGEVAIGSFLVNFIALPEMAAISEADAAHYVAWYWGGAMAGRFIGALVMARIPAQRVLMTNAIIAILLVLVAMNTVGWTAVYAILLVGLFNSIMFPTLFSLALDGLGEQASKGSGWLCLAIVGGAIVPVIQGALADVWGIQVAFIVPVICYGYIAFYGLVWPRLRAA